ncbi:MAG: DUF3833 family protein [Dokdonella sp.]
MLMKSVSLVIGFLIAVSASSSLQAESPRVVFTPQAGFEGTSEGNGILRLFAGRQRPFHVASHGYQNAVGAFQLDQTITFQGHAPHNRSWILTTDSDGHYSGTLTGIAGTVAGQTNGDILTLRYRVKGPFVMHQTLTLMSDGKTIDNLGTITLLGIPVGHLHETIDRKPSGAGADR